MEEGRINKLFQEVQGKSVVNQYTVGEYQNVNTREYGDNEQHGTPLLQQDIKSISGNGSSSTSNNVSSPSFSKTPKIVVKPETMQSSEAFSSIKSSSGHSTPSNVEGQEVDRASSRQATNMHLSEQRHLIDTKSQSKAFIKPSKGGQSDPGARGLINQVSKQNNNNIDKTVTNFTNFPDSASLSQNQRELTLGNYAEPVVGLFVGTAIPSIQLPSNMATTHGTVTNRSKLPGVATHSMTNFKQESTSEASVRSELQGNSSSVLTDHSKKVSAQDKKGSVLSLDSKGTNNSLHEFSNSAPTSDKFSGFRILPYNNFDSSPKLGHCSPLTVDTTVGSGHLSLSTLPSMSNNHPTTKPRKSRSKESKKKSTVERRMPEINDDDEDNDFIPVGMLQLSKKQDTQQVSNVPEDVQMPSFQQHFQYTGQLVQQIESQIQELQEQNLQSEMNNKRIAKSGNVTAGYQLQQLAQKLEPNPETSQQLLLQLVQQAQQQQKQLLDQQKHTRQGQQDQGFLAMKGQSLQKNQAVMAPQSQKALAVNTVVQRHTTHHAMVGQMHYDVQDARATSSQQSLTQGSVLQGAQCQSFNVNPFENIEHQQALESNEPAVVDKVSPLILLDFPTKWSEPNQQNIKHEHDPARHNNMTRQSDKTFFRSITPVLLSGHQNQPLNQQHPEIAKMLSSPVSPRQQISPRLSNSPRHTVSPNPYSDSQSHFASPYPRQTNSPRHSSKQVGSALPAIPHQHHIPSPQPNQPRSPHQNALSWQPISPSQPSPESPSLLIQTAQQPQATQGPTNLNYMSADYKTVQNNPSLICQPITVNLGHYKSSAPFEDLPSNQELELHNSHTQSFTSHIALRHESDIMTSPLSIPSHQPPQVFTPGQVIHHRPPEHKRTHTRITGKSRSALAVQSRFQAPLLDMSSSVPVPSVQNASAIWQQMQAKTIKSQFYPDETCSQVDNIQSASQAGDINQQHNEMLSSSMQSCDVLNSFSQQKSLKDPESCKKETIQSSDSLLLKISDAPSTASKPEAKLSSTVKNKEQASEPEQSEDFESQLESVGIKQTPFDQKASQKSGTDSQLEAHNSSIASETTSSSEKSGNSQKVLSKIASEGCVLNMSGQKESHSLKESSNTLDKDKPVDKINESVSEESPVSLDLKNGEHQDHGESEGKYYKMTTAEESLNNSGETPKREVRQRKPKKPFEQEDMPARRNQKAATPNQKNTPGSTSQKKQSASPGAVLSQKKPLVSNKPQSKVNVEKSVPEKEKPKKEKDLVTASSQHQKQTEEKKHQEKIKFPNEDSETDSKSENSRRLSQRLLVKEKEKEQKKNESNDDNTRRSQRHSSRIDYKEVSDPVEDAGSQKNGRASRRRSISITLPEEVPEDKRDRVTTRSKNRKEEDTEDKSSVKKHKEEDTEKSSVKKHKEVDTEKSSVKKLKEEDTEKSSVKKHKEEDTEKSSVKKHKEEDTEKSSVKKLKEDDTEKSSVKKLKEDDTEKSSVKKLKEDDTEKSSVKKLKEEDLEDKLTAKKHEEEHTEDKSSLKKRKQSKSEVSLPIKKLKEDTNVSEALSQKSRKSDKLRQEVSQKDTSSLALPSDSKNKKVVIPAKSKEVKKKQQTTSSLPSAAETRRMTTRQLEAEVDSFNSDEGNNKPKRLAPSEFIDELPQIRKRSRKPAVPEKTQGKLNQNTELKDSQLLKEQESVKGKETNIVESKSMDTNNKVSVSSNKKVKKRRRHHDYRSRSRRRRAFRSAILKRKAAGKDSESHENQISPAALVSTTTNEEPEKRSADNSDVKDESEAKKPQLDEEIIDQQQPIIVQSSDDPPKHEFQQPLCKSPPSSLSSSSASMIALSTSLSSSACPSAPKSTAASPLRSDRDSHLKSDTSNLLSGKEGELVQSQKTLASEKRKMVMYRLVPVLGEDMSGLVVSESLVPLSGYFVPGGNNDRILLPQNLLASFVGSKDLSTATADSSLEYKRSTVSPQKEQAIHQPSWSSEVTYTKSSSQGVTSSLQLSTVMSPLRNVHKVIDNSSAWTCEPPSLNQPWPSQLSHSINTPPPSVGEPKKPWTTPQPQPSPSAYGPSPSWNATPPSIMSSSPHSTSSSAWTMSSSSNLPNQSHVSSQAWPAICPQPPLQEPSWRSSPSATAGISESWSKEYFPDSGRHPVADHNGRRESMELDMGTGSNGPMSRPVNETYTYQSQNQSANIYCGLDQPLNSNLSYETSQEAEFNRPENLLQGLLRHVSNSTSADLAAFNLGQQDLAFLENRLRQTLSPNTIFSAVAAYDDNSGPSNNQDNSLQDSMNLVHTVNLDMEEANIDSSSQLDLSGFSTHPSNNGTPTTRVSEALHKPSQDPSFMLSEVSSTPGAPDVLPAPDSYMPKEEGKKEEKKMKERKHQYDIVLTEESRKFKCKACGKLFGSSTIYRHLRVHDPDSKIACDLCDKTYTLKQSLDQHKKKCHGEGSVIIPANVKGKSIDEEPRKEQEQKSHANDAKRQRKSSSSTDPLASSLDENELRKQLETHRQVEELRRMKAEKKAHCKGLGQAGDDPSCGVDSDIREEESMTVSTTLESQEFAVTQYDSDIQERAKPMDSSTCTPENTSMLPVVPPLGHATGLLHSAPKGHYQLNAPQPVMSTLAPVLKITATETDLKSSFIEGETQVNEELLSSQQSGDNTDLSKFNCTICNSQLGSKNGYMLHMRRHHKTKSKICQYCGKTFHTGQELKSHVRTHTGEKPYQCEICYVCFAHSGSFVSHKKGHTNRKEMEPFPIVNGEVQYPSTFRKPRLAGPKEEGAEKPKKRKKKAKDSAVTGTDLNSSTGNISMSPSTMSQSSIQTSVIRKNSLDSLDDKQLSGGRIDPGLQRGLSMNDQLLNSRGGHLYNAGMSEQQMTMSPSPDIQPGETYQTPSSGAASDYYNSYKDTSHQRHFMSPQSSPQDYYSQGKYYPQSSSAEQYSTDSTNQVVKSHQYSSNIPEDYSESVPTSGSYFSSQQTYSYDLPGSSNMEESEYQQEDYESNLPPYKPDPSSSEIVKKLLQHYNVPASSYQEPAPLDYGHQMQGMSDYTGSGCETAPPMYGSMEVSAPPSYSASVQQKQYYGGLAGGSLDYNALQQDSGMLLTQQTHSDRSSENQYTGILSEPHIQRETYRPDSTSRYSSVSEVYSEGQYNRPSSQQSYTQQTYDMGSAPRDTFRQGLPKIESLARDSSHLESGPKSL